MLSRHLKMRILLMVCGMLIDGSDTNAISHSVEDCGFTMRNGTISQNCTGFFTLQVSERTSIHACTEELKETFHSLVAIYWYNCSIVLTDYSAKRVLELPLYPLVLLSSAPLVLIICSCIVLALVIRRKLDMSEDEVVGFKLRGLRIQSESSYRSLSWKQLIVLALFTKVAEQACLPSMHTHPRQHTTRFEFDLPEGDSACFIEGTVTHRTNVEFSELGFLYNSTEWGSFVWSERGCGYGLCGTEGECAYSGELGRFHSKPSDGMFYLKYCKPHTTDFFTCVKTWGCWLATLEVYYKNKPSYRVYEIGSTTTDDDYQVDGLEDCSVEQTNLDPTDHFGMYVVVGHREEAWLCDKASETGKPKSGEIGDIQFLEDSQHPIFDFNSFACELSSVVSSGKCRVESSSLPTKLKNCIHLPGPTSQGLVEWRDGSLRTRGSSARHFTINCPNNHALIEADHQCHSLTVSLEGVRDVGHLNFISVSADSINKTGVLVLNSTCGDLPMVIDCNGVPHYFKLLRSDYHTCFPDIRNIADHMTDYEESSYSWKGGSSSSYFPVDHDTLVLIIGIICLIIIAMLFKCLFL